MRGKAFMAGTKSYLAALLTVLLFPLAWWRSFQIARRHREDDPRGVAKVAVAIVLGVVLAVGGVLVAVGFHSDSVDGIYDTLDDRMSTHTGNEAYRAAVEAGDQDETERLEPNHQLYLRVSDAVQAHDDAEAKRLVAQRSDDVVDDEEMDARTAKAFERKDGSVAALGNVMGWLVYPGLVGLFFAPLVWAVGSVVRRSWEPSDTVGFKPYPHGAASAFLFLGAFGVPALLFAGWAFMDLAERSAEGQISL